MIKQVKTNVRPLLEYQPMKYLKWYHSDLEKERIVIWPSTSYMEIAPNLCSICTNETLFAKTIEAKRPIAPETIDDPNKTKKIVNSFDQSDFSEGLQKPIDNPASIM